MDRRKRVVWSWALLLLSPVLAAVLAPVLPIVISWYVPFFLIGALGSAAGAMLLPIRSLPVRLLLAVVCGALGGFSPIFIFWAGVWIRETLKSL